MRDFLKMLGLDEDELRDILIALAVLVFFGWLVYAMGWFREDVDALITPEAAVAPVEVVNNDSDGDGIENTKDNCPLVLGIAANAGCPADSDEDGIADSLDECPDVPGVAEQNGCALPLAAQPQQIDTDGDGFYDNQDNCPAIAGTVNGCPSDLDQDGIIDVEDKCQELAGVIENSGCPADADNDGVYDTDDICADVAGIPANKGCPADNDGDGIYDKDDACPTVKGVELNKGCPADSDRDGIADENDNCPTQAGIAANKGCPADSDKDGIIDVEDKCPTKAGSADNNGCPELKITEAEQKTISEAVNNIQFFSNSARPTDASKLLLDKVSNILKANPDYKLKISGHTDSSGDDASNLALSKKRAFACFSYLVNSGIASKRLSHAGFGETKPVADNATREGRKQNRRVEFELHF